MQRGFGIAMGFSPCHLFPLIALKIEDVDVDAKHCSKLTSDCWAFRDHFRAPFCARFT